MLQTRPADRLRRKGYIIRATRVSGIERVCEQAGIRLRPLNRRDPAHGHLIGPCAVCGAVDAFYVDPDRSAWSCTSCGATGEGGADLRVTLIEIRLQALTPGTGQ